MIVHVVPEQENAGKRIRPPLMTLPCVLDKAAFGRVSIHSERRSGREPTCNERHTHRVCRALEGRHLDHVLSTERPVHLRDRKRGLLEPLAQIRIEKR